MTAVITPTTNTGPGTDTDTADTVEGLNRVQVLWLDPAEVAQHPSNIRDASRDIESLADSIRQAGVLHPVIVVPVELVPGHDFPAGVRWVVVDGNRRLRAALLAGVRLPAMVRSDVRTVRQTLEVMAPANVQRDDLTTGELAATVAALFQAKTPATAIGKLTGLSKTDVQAARKAAAVRPEVAAYDFTLAQLAEVLEFQDNPDDVAVLAASVASGQFEHTAEQLRMDRAEEAAITAAVTARTAELHAAGVAVLTEVPYRWTSEGPVRWVAALRNENGAWLDKADHESCPGHTIGLTGEVQGWTDDDEPEVSLSEVALCIDYQAHGHHDRSYHRADSTPTDDVAVDEAQGNAARLAAEEAARRARAELIRLNKAGDAAQVVRREFLHRMITAKSKHKVMTTWALSQVARRDRTYARLVSEWTPPQVYIDVIGFNPDSSAAHPVLPDGVTVWAQVVAAQELVYQRDAHRQDCPGRAAYLEHLVDLGYTLAEVEQLVITVTHPTPAPADTQPPTIDPH